MSVCLIGLGSNLGDRQRTLDEAVKILARHPHVRLRAVSRWHPTRPVGGPAGQPPYLNGAAVVETSMPPNELLGVLSDVEQQLGRQRIERWGPRSVDLDLLLYDQRVVEEGPKLVVPHPRMAWRRFVLEPAAEVAPAMVHPTTGRTIAQLLEHLNTAVPYLALAGPIGVGKTHLADMLADRTAAVRIAEAVDRRRLARFYADPAGSAWATEIEFLEERGKLLAADHPRWSNPRRLAVSDFWFDQSSAFAEVWLPADRRETFRLRWEQVQSGVVPPKLIVLLDAPLDVLVERIGRRGRPGERALGPEVLERIRQAILARAGRPGHAPVLRLAYDDPQRALDEVLAAVEAMQPPGETWSDHE